MNDVDRIMAVMDTAFDPAFGESWNHRQLADALVLPGTHYWLADETGGRPAPGEQVAGFALARAVLDEVELLLLAVRPPLRCRGLGAALLQRVIDDARAGGAVKLYLEMREGNPAESLYRRHGFESIGRRRNYYRRGSAPPRDAITFARTCV